MRHRTGHLHQALTTEKTAIPRKVLHLVYGDKAPRQGPYGTTTTPQKGTSVEYTALVGETTSLLVRR